MHKQSEGVEAGMKYRKVGKSQVSSKFSTAATIATFEINGCKFTGYLNLYASSVPAKIIFFKKEWFSSLQKVYHVAY